MASSSMVSCRKKQYLFNHFLKEEWPRRAFITIMNQTNPGQELLLKSGFERKAAEASSAGTGQDLRAGKGEFWLRSDVQMSASTVGATLS